MADDTTSSFDKTGFSRAPLDETGAVTEAAVPTGIGAHKSMQDVSPSHTTAKVVADQSAPAAKRAADLAKREAKLKGDLVEMQRREQALEQSKGAGALAALAAAGYQYDDAAAEMMGMPANEKEAQQRRKLAAQQTEAQQTIQNFYQQTVSEVAKMPDVPLTNATDIYRHRVPQLVEQVFAASGKIMPTVAAARVVEATLVYERQVLAGEVKYDLRELHRRMIDAELGRTHDTRNESADPYQRALAKLGPRDRKGR